MGEGSEHRREISPGTAELEGTETEEEEQREATLPKFSQARQSAHRAWEERKDQVFSVVHLVHKPSIGMFKKICCISKKENTVRVDCGEGILPCCWVTLHSGSFPVKLTG